MAKVFLKKTRQIMDINCKFPQTVGHLFHKSNVGFRVRQIVSHSQYVDCQPCPNYLLSHITFLAYNIEKMIHTTNSFMIIK